MKAHLIATGKNFDIYEVAGNTEPYTVSYEKNKQKWRCDCPHGSGNFKGECWHIRECRLLRHEKLPKQIIEIKNMSKEKIREFKRQLKELR